MSDDHWRLRWRGGHTFTSPPPDPPGADEAETIVVGWRTWRASVDPPRLLSLHDGTVWPPGQPLEAAGFAGAGIYAHADRSGVFAYADGVFRGDLAGSVAVFGQVAIWGNLGRAGELRGDFGYPLSIEGFMGRGPTVPGLLGELHALYGSLDERSYGLSGEVARLARDRGRRERDRRCPKR